MRHRQIKADIPGQSKDKINLNVDGNTLRLSVVSAGACPASTTQCPCDSLR